AVVLALFGRGFLLQKGLVALGLNLRQVGDDVGFASAAEPARFAGIQTPLCGNGHKACAPKKGDQRIGRVMSSLTSGNRQLGRASALERESWGGPGRPLAMRSMRAPPPRASPVANKAGMDRGENNVGNLSARLRHKQHGARALAVTKTSAISLQQTLA